MAFFTGINANDTASFMQKEYRAVFSAYGPEEGTELLDAYAAERFTGSAWTDYAYSLALWMWKHGRLTDKVRDRTLDMIRQGVSLKDYADPADKRARRKVLDALADRLSSPPAGEEKNRLDWNAKPVFRVGDVVSVRLPTGGHLYRPAEGFSEETFRALDGSWVAMRKTGDEISQRSALVPEIRDIWPDFELYDYLSDRPPRPGEIQEHRVVARGAGDGKMGTYRKHHVVVENIPGGMPKAAGDSCDDVFLSAGGQELLMRVLGLLPPPDAGEVHGVVREALERFQFKEAQHEDPGHRL